MAELRIVAGAWRGRRIRVPTAGHVRPTAARVREAWMSIVQPALEGALVLDLCAGSGALGLEALSRGAAHASFVERDPRVLSTLRENIRALGAEAAATVVRAEAVRFVVDGLGDGSPDAGGVDGDAAGPARIARTVAFADPPYGQGISLALAERWLAAPFAAIFGVEHETALTLPTPAGPATADRRVYGETAITLYRTGS
ncbi:MAG: RsmD family RNA methyltransferase [Gemmatimonadota bacterium]